MTINDIIEKYPTDIREHAERVEELVRPFGIDYMIVALLHDILEDTDIIYDDLLKIFSSYNSDIVDDIFTLTRKSNQTYFEYIDKITKSTKRVKIIKYYDILDHLHNKATLKPTLEKRYLKAKKILEEAI